ncbi:NUDIX domain-containing protein [Longispora sp. NPDC051575]|uniref:NUDIX hydrolase n=1 Tax=Longispora sp. NPDC051575 TaxID=3154943 RepID=UPI0034176778
MSTQRHRTIIDLHALLIRDGEILLGQRQGTGYADGQWHMPSGHLEDGESALDGLVREVKEEIGVVLQPGALRLVTTMHRGDPAEEARLGLFFEATEWDGEPANLEPHKCAELRWFPLDALPADMVPYPRAAVAAYIAGQPYAEIGW